MLARSLFNEHDKALCHMICIGKTKSTNEKSLLSWELTNEVVTENLSPNSEVLSS